MTRGLNAAVVGLIMGSALVGGGMGSAAAETAPDLSAALAADQACHAVFTASAFEGFSPSKRAGAGEPVGVDITWQQGNFSGQALQVVGCVSQNGKLVDRLATRLGGVENDGSHRRAFVVPADAGPGATVCHRAAVVGETPAGAPNVFRTGPTCYEVTAEPTPSSSGSKLSEIKTVPGSEVKDSPAMVAGKTETRAPDAAPASAEMTTPAIPAALPRTGSAERMLVFAAGVFICLGGFAAMFGARRRLTS